MEIYRENEKQIEKSSLTLQLKTEYLYPVIFASFFSFLMVKCWR